MTTHTDRIRQMAQEAGFGIGHSESAAELFERFAQLVAEDCARVCNAQTDEYGGQEWYATGCLDAAKAIRARYSLKD